MKKLFATVTILFAICNESTADQTSYDIACHPFGFGTGNWGTLGKKGEEVDSDACRYEKGRLDGDLTNAATARTNAITAADPYWQNQNKERANAGALPPGSYLSHSGIRGCGWASPAAAGIAIGGALVLGATAGAAGAVVGAGIGGLAAGTIGSAAAVGGGLSGAALLGGTIGGASGVALGITAGGLTTISNAIGDLSKFLTCTVDTLNGSVTSSIMTSLDKDSRCNGDIKINSNNQLKCTSWTNNGVGARINQQGQFLDIE